MTMKQRRIKLSTLNEIENYIRREWINGVGYESEDAYVMGITMAFCAVDPEDQNKKTKYDKYIGVDVLVDLYDEDGNQIYSESRHRILFKNMVYHKNGKHLEKVFSKGDNHWSMVGEKKVSDPLWRSKQKNQKGIYSHAMEQSAYPVGLIEVGFVIDLGGRQ